MAGWFEQTYKSLCLDPPVASPARLDDRDRRLSLIESKVAQARFPLQEIFVSHRPARAGPPGGGDLASGGGTKTRRYSRTEVQLTGAGWGFLRGERSTGGDSCQCLGVR